MKKGRRHGERSNNQGKEGEKMRMKKENKSCKGKRAKKKDTGEEEQEKDGERRRGKKGRRLGCLESLQMEEQKNAIVAAATSADHCQPNQTSRACVPHMSLFLFAGTQPACDHELRKSNTRTLDSTAQTPWTAHQRPRLSAVSGKKQKQHQSEFRLL